MNEQENKKYDTGEMVIKKGRFSRWFENFWYHYKWHSLISLFLIFTITICSLQMCAKDDYDVFVLYAGEHEINRQSEGGNFPEYTTFLASLEKVSVDFDENGEVKASLKDLFILSDAEIDKILKENDDPEAKINYTLLNENKGILRDTITYSNYYVCLLSPDVYEEYKVIDGVEIFAPLSQFVKGENSVEYYSESAVYLSSTKFYTLPGIQNLPTDTLVCLKNASVFASHFNEKETKENYERGKVTVENILNYR